MGNYTSIAEVGNGLVKVLREQLVPDILLNGESIGLCSPEDKGDLQLALFLYDIKESEAYRNSTMVNVNTKSQKYPSMYLSLYYMITAYSNGDIKFRAAEEQKILGKVVQTFNDYPMLDGKSFLPVSESKDLALQIELLQMGYDEKVKIWNVPNKAYKLSLFYKITPVEIESTKTRDIQRVVAVDFEFKEHK